MVQAILNQAIQGTLRLPLVQVSRVSKRFGEQRVLREIDLEVAEHELVVVVGRSGCGKSTLLRLLAGLETASEGQIFIDGRALKGPNPIARLMFQSSALLPWKSVLGNVVLAATRKHDAPTIAMESLGQVGLADRARSYRVVSNSGSRWHVRLRVKPVYCCWTNRSERLMR